MRGFQEDAAAPAVEILVQAEDTLIGFEPGGAGAGVVAQQAILLDPQYCRPFGSSNSNKMPANKSSLPAKFLDLPTKISTDAESSQKARYT